MATETKDLSSIPGIGPATIMRLEAAGISTLMALAIISPQELSTTIGMSEASARKIIKKARDSLNLGFEVAKNFIHKRDNVDKIGTGCSNFDSILNGGFESGSITEVYGQYGSGKTQLSHLITVKTLLKNKKNKTIFLDSEGTFRADRLKDFAEANKLDIDEVLARIYVARAHSSDHQMLLIDEVEKMVQKDDTYKLLVVDSLTSLFRSEFIGRGTLATRQQKLNKHLHQLLRIADIYNIIVIVTNQVMSDPAQYYGDPTKPVGGNIVGHSSTFRIYMRPGKSGSIYAKLVDSPNLPNLDCNFLITKEGFVNV